MKPKKLTFVITIENMMVKKKKSAEIAKTMAEALASECDNHVQNCDISITAIGSLMDDDDAAVSLPESVRNIVEEALRHAAEQKDA